MNLNVIKSSVKKSNKSGRNGLGKKFGPYTIILLIVLVVYAISLLLPLIWAFFNSFKTIAEFSDFPIGFPKIWSLENYKIAFTEFNVKVQTTSYSRFVYLPEMFLFSLLYALGCAFTATLTPCIMGYMTAKFPYKFSKLITAVVIVCMILPVVGSLPSEIQMAKSLGIYGHIWGLMIMRGHFLGMYFLIFQNVFKGVPKAFTEAAKIDGASNLKVFISIMLPLVSKTFFAVMLLKFIDFWNDYQAPMIYIKNYPTVAYGLFMFNFNSSNLSFSVPAKLAGAMAMMLPILVVYIVFRNKLVGNIQMGGIKG